MENPPPLDVLAERAKDEPANLDFRALCHYLGSDTYEVSSEAGEVRQTVIRELADPVAVVEAIWPLLTDEDDDVRRQAIDVLNRVVRVWPRRLAPRIGAGLDDGDVRIRGASADVLGGLPAGVVVLQADELFDRLDDEDQRVQALALSALSGIAAPFPEVITPRIEAIRPYLADRWVPEESSGVQLIYDTQCHVADVDGGEPEGSRLTNCVPRPFGSAVSILADVAPTNPEAIEPFLPRLVSIVESQPEHLSTEHLTIFRSIAKWNQEAIEPALPIVERAAEDDSSFRPRARNLLRELGRDLQSPAPVESPDRMADRDRPPHPDDEEVLAYADEDAVRGDLDFERLFPLFFSTDEETRDTALWALSCGFGVSAVENEIHERATTFLSLLDEPNDCARRHLLDILGSVAKSHPEAWLPPLVDLTGHENPRVRDGALTLLASIADPMPSVLLPKRAILVDAIEDEATQTSALFTLATLAATSPGEVRDLAPKVEAVIEEQGPSMATVHALEFLKEIARYDPEGVRSGVETATSFITDLAGPESITAIARWGRESSVGPVGQTESTLRSSLELCTTVGKTQPEAVETVRPHARRMAEDRYLGYKEALELLAVLDRQRSNR